VVVDVDYALYVQPIRMVPPSLERQHGPVLLAINLPAFVSIVRTELIQALAAHDPVCPWLLSIGQVPELDAVGVMVTKRLLPLALEDMAREAKHMASAGPATVSGLSGSALVRTSANSAPGTAPMGLASASAAMLHKVRAAVELARLGAASDADSGVLHAALEPAQDACFRVLRMATANAEDTSFRNLVESLSRSGISLQAALDAALAVRKVNAIWLQPQRLVIAGAGCLMLGSFLTTTWMVSSLLVLAGGIAWRLHLRRAAQAQVDTRLRAFIRFGDKVLGKMLGG